MPAADSYQETKVRAEENIQQLNSVFERVLAFDASPLVAAGLASGILKPTVRFQAYVTAEDIFGKPVEKRCLCGCGQKLGGARRKWATNDCGNFGLHALYILKGHTATIRQYLEHQRGACCAHCWQIGVPLEVDHILPVAHGGAGRWLDNYQLLCHGCHLDKTAADNLKYKL